MVRSAPVLFWPCHLGSLPLVFPLILLCRRLFFSVLGHLVVFGSTVMMITLMAEVRSTTAAGTAPSRANIALLPAGPIATKLDEHQITALLPLAACAEQISLDMHTIHRVGLDP